MGHPERGAPMPTTDLSAEPTPAKQPPLRLRRLEASAKAEADLTPDERLCELAAILAAGILRLKTGPQLVATADVSAPDSVPEESSDSTQKRLDLSAPRSPHVLAG